LGIFFSAGPAYVRNTCIFLYFLIFRDDGRGDQGGEDVGADEDATIGQRLDYLHTKWVDFKKEQTP
jgi:hypothetical protein